MRCTTNQLGLLPLTVVLGLFSAQCADHGAHRPVDGGDGFEEDGESKSEQADDFTGDRPCEGNGVEPIGCDWFVSDNCWAQSVWAAEVCAHGVHVEGRLTTDGARCSFEDGTEIIFHNPIDLEDVESYVPDFEIQMGGEPCMFFKEFIEGIRLTTSLGVFEERLIYPEYYLDCPDGRRYATCDVDTLIECPLDYAPGYTWGWTTPARKVTFYLTGYSPRALTVFVCSTE